MLEPVGLIFYKARIRLKGNFFQAQALPGSKNVARSTPTPHWTKYSYPKMNINEDVMRDKKAVMEAK